MNSCRLCKLADYESAEPLFKYSVRHYVHASCGLDRWGIEFLFMIPRHEVGSIPYRLLEGNGRTEIKKAAHQIYANNEAEWRGAICKECYRPISSSCASRQVGRNWEHTNSYVKHEAVPLELHR